MTSELCKFIRVVSCFSFLLLSNLHDIEGEYHLFQTKYFLEETYEIELLE